MWWVLILVAGIAIAAFSTQIPARRAFVEHVASIRASECRQHMRSESPSAKQRRKSSEKNADAGNTHRAPSSRGAPGVLVVLGSGGHTTELLRWLESVPAAKLASYGHRWYLFAAGDKVSEQRARLFEKTHFKGNLSGSAASPLNNTSPEVLVRYVAIPRSRAVGQSFLTAPFSTLWAFVACCVLMFDRDCPRLVLTAGPGTCLPVVLAARLLRATFGASSRAGFRVWFCESIARVDHLSLTAKIVWHARLADAFCVYWTELARRFRAGVRAIGPLDALRAAPGEMIELIPRGYVFVTVGTTAFDALLEAVADARVLQCLADLGFERIILQIGTGSDNAVAKALAAAPRGFGVESFRTTNKFHDIVAKAGLVIGHTGAGTVLDCIDAGVPLLTVPNELLMHNHQLGLAKALEGTGLVVEARVGKKAERAQISLYDVLNSWRTRMLPVFRRLSGVSDGQFADTLDHLASHTPS